MSLDIKDNIQQAIKDFSKGNLFESSIQLFSSLGYKTERQSRLSKNTYRGFIADFPVAKTRMNTNKTLQDDWKSIELVFQLTQSEMSRQSFLFDSGKIDNAIIEAYLFFAIELSGKEYTRTQLSDITRELNKVFSMPVMVLFKYESSLTLAVIKRRLHKRDESKDVLEKITLIKEINIEIPHRAHIEILYDLSFEKLQSDFEFRNFVELHNAWQKTLDSSELNKRFYKELANWYFWAVDNVEFPDDVEKDREKRNSTNVIRMLTRLIFVWFLKEKDNLIPDDLFNKKKLDQLLDYKDKTGSTYYKAILQNLFFATLNTEMNKDVPGNRTFIKRQYGIQEFYRYERFFKDKEEALKLFENIPFLNGGLFENLDKNVGETNEVRIDCFSNKRDNEERLNVPDYLFFEPEKQYDKLNKVYDTKNKKYVVRGLLEILKKYKFTIHENTPIEEEIALDPELLGKVFENLLASYNDETKTTARKLTGSFYTPREVVNHMVDESLISYLNSTLSEKGSKEVDERLRVLFSYSENVPKFTEKEIGILIEALDTCKIADPACGSGAFPMGILHKMVFILSKLDPQNDRWKQRQIDKVYDIPDTTLHENLKAEIEKAFNENFNDYGRKLYLIENCIYGVDIQPIAVQIAKLRFFISLIVDQKVDRKAKNLGIRPLPNLETKFVAGNTLIGIDRPNQLSLRNAQIDVKEKQLHSVRERHFNARTPATKKKYRERDKELRKELADLLESDGFKPEATRLMASWDPYDQNKFAGFFDSEWMFGLQKGFDVVIGNPPYVSANNMSIHDRNYFNKSNQYATLSGKWDMYIAFMEKSLRMLSDKGAFTFIIPFGFLNQPFAEELRKLVLNDFSLLSIADLHNNKIFESATVPSCIPLIVKQPSKQHQVKISEFVEGEFKIKYFIDIEKYHQTNQNMFRTENLNLISGLIDKVKEKGHQLDKDFYISTGAEIHGKESRAKDGTTISGTSKFDVLLDKYSKGLKPYIEGSSIEKSKDGRYSFPVIETWLDYNKADVMRSPKFKELFDSDKIIIRRSSGLLRILAIYDQRKIYTSEKCLIIVARDCLPKNNNQFAMKTEVELKYILAIINSKLVDFYYESVYGGFIDVYPNNLKELPINPAKQSDRQAIISIVDILLELKKINQRNDSNKSMCVFFDSVIDAMVFELYFPESIQAANAEVIGLIKKQVSPINQIEDSQDKLNAIEKIHKKLSEPNNEIRNRIIKQNIAVEEIKLINQSLSKDANTQDNDTEL